MADFEEAIKQSFDIRSQFVKIERFADMMMRNFIEMIGKIIKYTKKFILGSFEYSKIVWLFFSFIFIGILLFSKNRFGALVVLAYFFMLFATLNVILIFIFLVLYIIALCIENVQFWINLNKELQSDNPPEVTGKRVWQIIKQIFIIIWIIILIFFLGFLSYGVKIFSIANNVLFDTANRLYTIPSRAVAGAAGLAGTGLGAMGSGLGSMGSIGSMGAMGALGKLGKGGIAATNSADSFGAILRKILEKCS